MLSHSLTRVGFTALLLLPLLTSGCSTPEPAAELDPASAMALEVFSLAAATDPDRERLEAVFGPFSAGPPADLYDALRLLADAASPRIVRREVLEELGREVIDLEAVLPGEGQGAYSVQLDPDDDEGRLRVTWFQGPGVAWPPRRTPRDDGLSSSPIE